MKTTLLTALLLLATTMLLYAVLSIPSAGDSGALATPRPVAAEPVPPPRPWQSVARVPASEAPREIGALLALLRASPCRFERNGRWYDGGKAADHLQRKLDYAVGRGMTVGTTEAFIEQAATRSSFSGRAYRVQCGELDPVPASDWFLAELAGLRRHDRPI